jgi:hypothetical protein
MAYIENGECGVVDGAGGSRHGRHLQYINSIQSPSKEHQEKIEGKVNCLFVQWFESSAH